MSNCNKLGFSLFIVLIAFVYGASAQSQFNVSGSVVDSLKKPIEGVSVKLVTEKDTLKSISDANGNFSLSKVNSNKFYLELTALGYKAFTSFYEIETGKNTLALEPILLKVEVIHLKDVDIKGKVDPIKIKRDTIEYNAAAYTIRQNDMVEDLLKQLQGVEVDANGAVTTMGKKMTKLRVNGKDFFTGNVEDYIRQLPAEIIAKIQIINDYGDLANFTGVKKGEPQKMLNLVIKPGMDNGMFGAINAGSSTLNAHNLGVTANIWKPSKQVGLGTRYGFTHNDLTTSNNKGLNGNIRTDLSKSIKFNAGYNLADNSNRTSESEYLETFNPQGNIYDLQTNARNASGLNSTLNLGLNAITKSNFLTLALNASLNNNKNVALSASNKTGFIRQDLFSNSSSQSNSPNISGSMQCSRRLANSGSSLSMGLNFDRSEGNSDNTINDIIKYYNETTNILVKDSLLNRLVNNNNLNSSISGNVEFSNSLTKANDTTGRHSFITLSYSFSLRRSENLQTTNATNPSGNVYVVDSLSQHFISTAISQAINLNFNRDTKKVSYSFGINFSPNLIIGRYPNTDQSIRNYQTNFSPSGNLTYQLKQNRSLGLNYGGSTNSPDFNELQPVKNSNNLQNVIIGNPNLKATSTHLLGLSYNDFGEKSGLGIMLGVSGAVTVNSSVSKTVFLKDTLNSLKQQTTYENVNGNYNIRANYSVSKRLLTNKLSLSISGNIGYSHNVFYADTVLNASSGINVSNNLNCSMNAKSFSFNTGVSYSFSSNTYSVMNQNISNVQILAVNGGGSWMIGKKFRLNASASKSFNYGYSLTTGSPLLLNMGMNAVFLKSNKLTFSMQANDLFNQGSAFSSVINNNSISQNRTRFISRFVQATLGYSLNHFGGRKNKQA